MYTYTTVENYLSKTLNVFGAMYNSVRLQKWYDSSFRREMFDRRIFIYTDISLRPKRHFIIFIVAYKNNLFEIDGDSFVVIDPNDNF